MFDEIGASSIIATGDSVRSGKINIEGSMINRIKVFSDNIASDSEFIIIDSDSSSNSTLKCVDFFGGWCNVQIYNKRLSEAISNCRFYGADFGVYQNGIDELTDIRFSLFYWNYISLYLEQEGSLNNETECLIDNVVIDNQFEEDSYGIIISGLQTTSDFSLMNLTNSIITNSYAGWYIDNSSFYPPILSNLAYHGNSFDGSHAIPEKNPMVLSQSPFLVPEDPNEWPYYIDPNSVVANVNLGYDLWQSAPEQLLTTVFKDFGSRGNTGIGFGVPLFQMYSNVVDFSQCDFDESGRVDFPDFSKFSMEWQTERGSSTNPVNFPDLNGYSVADFNRDDFVNTFDLQIFCQDWLSNGKVSLVVSEEYSTSVYISQCDFDENGRVDFSDFSKFSADWLSERGSSVRPVSFPDPNGYSIADFNRDEIVDVTDLQTFCQDWLYSGQVNLIVTEDEDSITVTASMLDGIETGLYAIFLDGKHIASRDPDYNPELVIDKMKLGKGKPNLRAVIKGANGVPYVTRSYTASVSTPLNSLHFDEVFDPEKYYRIRGNVDQGYSVNVSIVDNDEQVVWSGNFTDDFNLFIDPNDVVWDDVGYTVTYGYESLAAQGMSLNSMWDIATAPSASSSSSSSASSAILALGGKPTSRTAGLLLCMREDGMDIGANDTDTGTIRYAAKMMKQKGITPIILRGYGTNNQVNYATFRKVFKKYRNIRYKHIYAHGNNQSNGSGFWGINTLRTRLRFNDGDWPAFNSRIWTNRGLEVPEGYKRLSNDLEAGNCLAMFPYKSGQLIVTVVESCLALRNVATMDAQGLITYIDDAYDYETHPNPDLNAHPDYPYSDISMAFNIWTDKQVVLGSAEVVIRGSAYPYWRRFFNKFWYGLRNNNSAYDSLMDEAIPVANMSVLNGFRYRGIGLSNAYLKTNP